MSAPRLLAEMLELLQLRPGMRVLEIGAGSGYTAALLAELVGDPALVTTIDIDEGLVEAACERLAATGYGGVIVVAGDGHVGVPNASPFDRVVATVGCVDLAPAWFDQLAADGFLLIPVQHGGVHPLMEASADNGTRRGKVVGRASFVPMQGRQASSSPPWPFGGRLRATSEPSSEDLPADLLEVFAVEPGRERVGGTTSWDFTYYLALADHRAAHLGALSDGRGSGAAVGRGDGKLWFSGDAGRDLADELIGHVRDWIALGRPAATDYSSEWVPGGRAQNTTDDHVWVVERVDHDEVVRLRSDG